MTDDELLRKPIVIIGSPRSGTTLLSQVLKHHPMLHLANEPRILWKYGNERKSDLLRRSDARSEVRSHIRREFANRVRQTGKQRLLEKTPSNSLRINFVDEVLSDCKIVHILRDGVQSALSIRAFWQNHSTGLPKAQLRTRLREIKLRQVPYYAGEFARRALGKYGKGWVKPPVWGPRLPGMDGLVRDLELLEVCCLQWRGCVEAACNAGRKLPPHRYMECRLEDIEDELLQQIMEFCDLPPSTEVIEEFHKQFDPSQPKRRTPNADQAEIEQIREWIGPTLSWLGMDQA